MQKLIEKAKTFGQVVYRVKILIFSIACTLYPANLVNPKGSQL